MDKQPNPKISIIVPVYKVEEYLPQCIESLINQTCQNIEIILVNDGSPDNSGKICDEYATKDERIKVVHQRNAGLSGARNKGLKISSGDYIMFLDSDDWLSPEACENAIESAIDNHADIVFWGYIKVFSQRSLKIHLFENNLVFEDERKRWLHRRLVGLINEELLNPAKTDAYNSAWGKLYRRNLIQDNQIFFLDTKEVGSEDVLFNINAFWFANKTFYLNKFLNYYRQDNPNALTKNHGSTLFPRFLTLFSHIDQFIKINNLPSNYNTALKNRIALSIINNVLSISSPRNKDKTIEKLKAISKILSNKTYREALLQLRLSFLPFHWKVFFITCKHRLEFFVFLQARLMLRLK